MPAIIVVVNFKFVCDGCTECASNLQVYLFTGESHIFPVHVNSFKVNMDTNKRRTYEALH